MIAKILKLLVIAYLIYAVIYDFCAPVRRVYFIRFKRVAVFVKIKAFYMRII